MSNQPFVDYYEIFEASPNASSETIERLFRYLAKHMHPDAGAGGDIQKFSELVEAYHALKDPGDGAADILWRSRSSTTASMLAEATLKASTPAERHRLIRAFHFQPSSDAKQAALLSLFDKGSAEISGSYGDVSRAVAIRGVRQC